ncbi:MAG: sugar transferase [Mariniphaga sp.]|nr:sugar transferase [Mariniphaga sp.]
MLKRTIDIFGALIGLVLLSPLLVLLYIIVRLNLGSPVIFKQRRPGLKGKGFSFYKLRTMNDARNSKRELLADKDRITSVGSFLRKTSLDELPSLYNVLIGDMSLVGPRPLLVEYLDLYSPEQGRRHEVKPGVTGWAQINGRNSISWAGKFKLDVWYVDNYSLLLDLKILIITIIKVIKKEGISQQGSATMEAFKGNEN